MGRLFNSYKFAGIVALAFLANVVRAEAQGELDQLSIKVRIYNMAQIPNSKLMKAIGVAENVFQKTGVQMLWQECTPEKEGEHLSLDCDSKLKHTDILVNLIPHLEGLAPSVHLNALGCSIMPNSGAPPTMAYVDYSRVRRLAGSVSFDVHVLLGLAIVHEIGHLLLGNNSHSFSGIMRSPWRTRDLQRRYWEEFLFTNEQAQRIRAAALARNQLERPPIARSTDWMRRPGETAKMGGAQKGATKICAGRYARTQKIFSCASLPFPGLRVP